jgi:GNAT superfamily N-acetyltransferase
MFCTRKEIPPAWRKSTSAPDGTANIAYFGLMPEAQGKHLGFFFLYHTCMNAWAHPISRLLVNTCTLDSPRALPLYQRMGFHALFAGRAFVELAWTDKYGRSPARCRYRPRRRSREERFVELP